MGAIMRTNGAGDMLAQATTLIKASRDCIQTMADYLALAADAIEKGSEHEGQCASCGMVGNYDHHDDHAPHCLVREIRALLAGHEDEHEAEHPRCVAPILPPAETFAVIRYVGERGGRLDAGICAPLGEAEWDQIGKGALGWKLVCRSIPTREMAESIAWALSSPPFSE
jgi:hypothetical protein